METKTKQRLIGGVVLLAVVAIFLPLLFHNARPSVDLKVSNNVPTPPNSPEIQMQLPLQNAESTPNTEPESTEATVQETPAITRRILNTAPLPVVTRKASNATPLSRSPVTTQTASNKMVSPHVHPKTSKNIKEAAPAVQQVGFSTPIAWVIQAASFSDQENVDRLVKHLRTNGLDVYTRKSASGDSVITRVYVGPEINLNKMKKVQRQLEQQFKLKGVIKKYTL